MKQKLDYRWIILLTILILVVCTTAFFQADRNDGAKTILNTIDIEDNDTMVNWGNYPTENIVLTKSLEITKPGTYYLTGTIDNGYIHIKSDKDSPIRLILDNATIRNDTGPGIYCESTNLLSIELVGENTIEDGRTYNMASDISGAIYSESDLSIGGQGSLSVIANYSDGIVGKDDLKIKSGDINISSKDDGLRGTDSVHILGGKLIIDSAGDSIKTTAETNPRKGFVLIEDGDFVLTSSAKGIKATNKILIHSGRFLINSMDDAIHSDNYIIITDGILNISSKDDAIHANAKLIIDGGEIEVTRAYEGIEAQNIVINNGKISLVTLDDGINAGGGVDGSSLGRSGASLFDRNEECIIIIGGGDIYINASGDGIDSNGWLYIKGGRITVDGPTNDGNGAIDYSIDIIMSGGEVVAVGASGMAETLGDDSSVINASIYLSETMPAGTKLEITDLNNNLLASHTSAKSFSHIAIGLRDFAIGNAYTLYIDDKKLQTFTLSGTTTIIGEKPWQNMPSKKPRTSQ